MPGPEHALRSSPLGVRLYHFIWLWYYYSSIFILSHFATPNNLNGRRRKWFVQQELQREFWLWDQKQKAAGRAGVKYNSSQSVKTGYLGCLFQFTWETWGILTFVRTGAAISQQHPDWPDLHLPTPTSAQAVDFSFCIPHLLCILLPGSYLLLAQSQNTPLATWASSHALFWATQATTHGSLVSAWKTEEFS